MNNLFSGTRGLHITIGTYPSRELSLEQELRLLKAALLYGDHVKLYSLTSSMMSMVLRQRDFSPRHQMQLIEKVIPYLKPEKEARVLLKSLKKVKKKSRTKHLSGQDRALLANFQQLLAEQWEAIKEKATEIARDAGFDEMERAVQAGLLELHTFEGTDNNKTVLEFMTDCIAGVSGSPRVESRRPEMSHRSDKLIWEFVERVSNAVSDGSTYPLFDAETSGLVMEEIDEKRLDVSESDIERGRHGGLAGDLLKRLPLFDQATVDEVLDIRRELERPLTRFRGAVVQFSGDIRSTSWDKDFPPEAEKMFYRDVGPAILDIEDAVKSNKLLASILRKFVDKPMVLPTGSIFTLVISQLSSLPNEIALSLGVGISSAAIIYDAYREWKQEKQVIEQNQLFFYYEAQKRLSK